MSNLTWNILPNKFRHSIRRNEHKYGSLTGEKFSPISQNAHKCNITTPRTVCLLSNHKTSMYVWQLFMILNSMQSYLNVLPNCNHFRYNPRKFRNSWFIHSFQIWTIWNWLIAISYTVTVSDTVDVVWDTVQNRNIFIVTQLSHNIGSS